MVRSKQISETASIQKDHLRKNLPDGTHVDAFTKEEILSCYQDYVTACKWFEAAGWEGVMIHCGHGWLPAQFLSPQYNKRTDEYGGSFENRARFTVDLLKLFVRLWD